MATQGTPKPPSKGPKGSKAPAKGPRKDVLASLKLAQIEVLKPVLPAEILDSILDYLAPTDLIRVARTSKRMQEMVYEDTRWVRLLKRMGCWNEMEARKLAERRSSRRSGRFSADSKQLKAGVPTIKVGSEVPNGNTDDSGGFDEVKLSAAPGNDNIPDVDFKNPLTVMRNIRSTRGKAREEYGKVHAALSPFYEDIANSETSTDSLVFKRYDTPEQQALLLAQLQSFAKSDMGPGSHLREQRLSDIISLFESAALREFRNGYESGDIDGLVKKYAHVLTALNDGREVVQIFIHHNHIITRKTDFGSPTDCINSATGTESLEQTQAFLTRLSVAFNEEVSIIDRCFPCHPNIAASFLEKIRNDVLSPYFTTLFDELHATNPNLYLEAVSGAFSQTLNFVRGLHPIQSAGDDFYAAVDEAVEKIFEPHVELYLAEELEQFRKRSDAMVVEWDRQLSEQAASAESLYMSNINRHADKKDFLTSFKKVIMAPVNIFPGFSSKPTEPKDSTTDKPSNPLGPNYTPTMNRSSTFVASIPAPPTPAELPTTELAAKAAIMNSKLEGIRSLFSIEVALDLVHSSKASLERAAQFVKLRGEMGVAARLQCEAIFVSLLDILGHRHVIAGFDKAVDRLSLYRPREQNEQESSGVEPLVTFLELVNVGDLILQMIDVYYEQELIGSNLTDRSDFLDPAVKGKKKFEQKLDERVATGLNKGIDVLMEEVQHILATKQTPADFYPESVDAPEKMIDIGPSDTAQSIVKVVSSHTRMLIGSTDKSTLDVFNQEIGLQLFGSLCKHLKRQRISTEGSIKLISDMNHYFTFIQSMKNEQLLLYFTALRELSQVYLIHASDAKDMAAIIADVDRFHGIFRAEEVYEFAERRADWYQVKRSVERAMFGFGCSVM